MSFTARVLTGAAVTGLGSHRPPTRVGNAGIAERIGSSDEWIRERSGIVTRGISDRSVVDMGTDAAAKALASAGVDADQIGLVLLATCSLPGPLPGGSPEIAARLGATSAGASDIGAGCAGFAYAVGLAADTVRTGTAKHVLVIGSELLTPMVDPDDRGTAFLFGDGAGAVVVSASAQERIGPVVWSQDGAQRDRLVIEGNPLRLAMEGRAVYRWATTTMPALARWACAAVGVEPADLRGFLPLQANLRITESVVAALDLPD
ncbi:MAG: 3-oxoacyl-(acyl-carrier-protein) synthase, partial [Frankiales bacterium]|nr:3-oxoacyl-(acyl-carrier-protein) synthase [Frankiales bacterium]